MDVKGEAAVVTGGGSGMGAETARHLAAAGARVACLDIDGAAAGEVAQEVGGLGLACDVTSANDAEAALARAREAHGAARVLVNCAGIAPPKRIVGRDGPMALADFEKVIAVNLVGTFNMMRLAAADMQGLDPVGADEERGVIVSTSSIAAGEGQVGQAAYGASKAGVVGLTLPAAREFARFGIRVMTIAPGLIATPMLLQMPQEVQDSLAAQVPFPRRFGHAHEFARLVLHICANAMLNGADIRLDGAMRMQAK